MANGLRVEAACAICGAAPSVPECPHEGQRLELALDQAIERWSGVQVIRYENSSLCPFNNSITSTTHQQQSKINLPPLTLSSSISQRLGPQPRPKPNHRDLPPTPRHPHRDAHQLSPNPTLLHSLQPIQRTTAFTAGAVTAHPFTNPPSEPITSGGSRRGLAGILSTVPAGSGLLLQFGPDRIPRGYGPGDSRSTVRRRGRWGRWNGSDRERVRHATIVEAAAQEKHRDGDPGAQKEREMA